MKNGSKTLVALIACSLLATPAWAAEKQERPLMTTLLNKLEDLPFQAQLTITGVRDDIPLLKNMRVGTISHQDDTYTVTLSNAGKTERSDEKATATIKVKEDGELISLKVKEPDAASGKLPDLHGDKKLVNDFVNYRLSPDFTASSFAVLGIEDGQHENKAIWSVYPTINGVPLQKKAAEVVVNGDRDIVFVKRENVKLPNQSSVDDPRKAVPVQKAKDAIAENLKLELVYDEENGSWLYLPRTVEAVNALTGEPVSPMRIVKEEQVEINGQADLSAWQDSFKLERVLKAELQLPSVPVDIGEETKTAAEKNGRWDASVTKAGIHAVFDKEKKGWTISVDDEARKEREEPLSDREASKMAVNFVQNALISGKKSFLVKEMSLSAERPKWAEKSKDYREYTYAFHEVFANGAIGLQPLYTIVVDADRGGIRSVEHKMTKRPETEEKLASVKGKAATDAILRDLEVSLYYIYPEYGGQTPSLPQLVYLPVNMETLALNAQTGEPVKRVPKEKQTDLEKEKGKKKKSEEE
ncbi:hypothetical protein [Brevibacillus borstelensis]|uniref:hypothetical protein n=1 Tax=Brevibacillus borstelensis TaxID=45462 RepID=UPI002E1D33EB|nr:hypothetical protein [Brevibacillus borstelensis]